MKAASWCLCFQAFLLLHAAAAEPPPAEAPADKRAFNFFQPTPVELLREMTTDGPGATESPYTVDAGHFQLEMAFADYTSEQEMFDGEKYQLDWLAVAPMNLKVGLLNSLDLQLLLEPYHHVFEREDDFTSATHEGFGDTTVRLKYNLWGNDRGRTAGAVLPFIKFPTSQPGVGSEEIEGGVMLLFAAELPWDFQLGLASRYTDAQDILEGQGHHNEFANSIELAHPLFGDLEGYVEFFSNVSTEAGVGWVGRFDTGLVYWLTDDLQLNAGVNIGLTKWADDWNVSAGVAWRY